MPPHCGTRPQWINPFRSSPCENRPWHTIQVNRPLHLRSESSASKWMKQSPQMDYLKLSYNTTLVRIHHIHESTQPQNKTNLYVQNPNKNLQIHDDVIKWKHFPRYWPAQRPVTRSFHVFFDLHLNKPLSKQSWGWWFEMLSRPLWRDCNDILPCKIDLISNTCVWIPMKDGYIHRNLWPHKRPVMQSFDVFVIVTLNKLLNKQVNFLVICDTLMIMWHHCNDTHCSQRGCPLPGCWCTTHADI